MYKGHRYIDADSHVLEPVDMWEKYLEPKFRRYAPTHGVGYRGDPPGFLFAHQNRRFGDAELFRCPTPSRRRA